MKKKKSKEQNLLSPSSSWRENPNLPKKTSNTSTVSSGCLPGFFKLFLSTFNRRKSITIGSKKQEHKTIVYTSPPQDLSNGEVGRKIVAPQIQNNVGDEDEDEARMSLVGALEKCDRDLEELRRTIDVIKSTYILHKKLEVSSPITRENSKFSDTVTGDVVVGTGTQKNMKTTQHEPENTDTTVSIINHHEYRYKVNNNNINLITRPEHYIIHDVIPQRTTSTTESSCATFPLVLRRVKRSLKESVNQVCDDVASGQRREVSKIGLALYNHICRDLIAETVRELSFSDDGAGVCYGGGSKRRHIRRGSSNSLPFDACRRRLAF